MGMYYRYTTSRSLFCYTEGGTLWQLRERSVAGCSAVVARIVRDDEAASSSLASPTPLWSKSR